VRCLWSEMSKLRKTRVDKTKDKNERGTVEAFQSATPPPPGIIKLSSNSPVDGPYSQDLLMGHTVRTRIGHTVKTSVMGHTVKDLLTMESNIRSSSPQAAGTQFTRFTGTKVQILTHALLREPEWTPVHAAVNRLRQSPFRDDGPRSRISSSKADEGPCSRPSSLTADGLSVDETSGVKAADFFGNRIHTHTHTHTHTSLVAMIEAEIDRQLREAELFPVNPKCSCFASTEVQILTQLY
jgi:hypothetical protein